MATEVNGQPAGAAPVADDRETARRRRPLLIAAGLYVVATGVAAAVAGEILLSRDVVFAWLMGGLLILSLNNPARWVRGLVVDWLPFILFLFAYDYARSIADTTGFTPHLSPQLHVEKLLFGFPYPTVWLQSHLYHPPAAAWYDYGVWGVYLTHFFGTLTVAALTWRFAYPLFKRWRTLVIWLSSLGFVTYVLYPAVPPWLASRTGQIPHIEPIGDREELGRSGRGRAVAALGVPADDDAPLLAQGLALAHPVRALHARDGVHAGVHRRALRRRHPGGMGVRAGRLLRREPVVALARGACSHA